MSPLNQGLRLRAEPNPARGVVELMLEGPAATVLVYDVTGRLVRRLSSPGSGARAVRWDGDDEAGQPAPAGAYVAEARAGMAVAITRFVRLR